MGNLPKVLVGSKGVALSVESIYNVAHRLSAVEVEPSTIEHLFQTCPKNAVLLPAPSVPQEKGKQLMLDAEARATLVVLLNKLLQGTYRLRPFLPIFLSEILNLGIAVDLPSSSDDLSVVRALVWSIYKFKDTFPLLHDGNGNNSSLSENAVPGLGELTPTIALSKLKSGLVRANVEELGVTQEELELLEGTFVASIAVAAVSVHSLSSLSSMSEAIIALSCEALHASTLAFETDTSIENFVHKSEADVASDLRCLLSGSRLTNVRKGGVDGDVIWMIPAAHGSLRDSLKVSTSRLRIEINRAETSRKKQCLSSASSNEEDSSASLFTNSLLTLVINLWSVLSGSRKRLIKAFEMIRGLEKKGTLQSEDTHLFAAKLEGDYTSEIENFREVLSSALSGVVLPDKGNRSVSLLREFRAGIKTWRKALATEAAIALALLASQEMLLAGNEIAKEGSRGRRKTDFVLGKGTLVVRQHLNQQLQKALQGNDSKSLSLQAWTRELEALFLNPNNPDLEALLLDLKKIVESNEMRRVPKIAKGTRDFKPDQMAIREKAFGIIVSVFKRHGAVALDTPVFELRETLMGKYGEDSKLIYDLADQGGEILSLRYDLTVPFARYLAMNKVAKMKRYHIARVYRRDKPSQGRYREFYQCDFDIAGQYDVMIPDFEVLKVLTELLDELDIGHYEVKLNHRKLLDGMLEICGVPPARFRSICSAIDKLDKLPWEQVRKEMVEEKGLSAESADKIGTFVQKRGDPMSLLQELKEENSLFLQHTGSTAALEELDVLFKYLQASKCLPRIVFDLSLARGLDYYTGVIYEAVFKGTTQVGSIAAGGRYDDLVGMFSGKPVPAVGVSLGIERVLAIMEQQEEDSKKVMRATQTEVLVVVVGKNFSEEAVKLVTELWEGKLKAEFACVPGAKLKQQLANALESGIPWMIVVGEDEMKKGVVQLKDLSAEKNNLEIHRENLVSELQKRIQHSPKYTTVVQ